MRDTLEGDFETGKISIWSSETTDIKIETISVDSHEDEATTVSIQVQTGDRYRNIIPRQTTLDKGDMIAYSDVNRKIPKGSILWIESNNTDASYAITYTDQI